MKLIDADALMEAIEIRMKSKEDDFKAISELMAINRYIAQVSPVKKQDSGWIPVEERLPEEPYGCLVTIIDMEPMTQTEYENILPYHVGYDGESWNDGEGEVMPFEVVAWMPLPEPYRPEALREAGAEAGQDAVAQILQPAT